MTTTCTTIEPKPRDDHDIPDDALNQILHELLHTSFSTDKILAERNLKVSTFASWITSERALNLFRSLKEISLLRAQIIAADRTLRAIIALGTIVSADVESPRHAETIRKAATTLIKLTDTLNTIATPTTTDPPTHTPTNPQRKQGPTTSSLPSDLPSSSDSSPSPSDASRPLGCPVYGDSVEVKFAGRSLRRAPSSIRASACTPQPTLVSFEPLYGGRSAGPIARRG